MAGFALAGHLLEVQMKLELEKHDEPAPVAPFLAAKEVAPLCNEVCLDCGYRGKMLRRHIATQHGLSRDDYRQRWRLRSNHPLTAPAYSEHRSTTAKVRGFGRKLATPVALAEKPTASPAPVNAAENPKARRASKSRPVSKSKVAGEAAAAPSAKKRRSRVAMVASPSG
jgi:predicted transcriptional regulator